MGEKRIFVLFLPRLSAVPLPLPDIGIVSEPLWHPGIKAPPPFLFLPDHASAPVPVPALKPSVPMPKPQDKPPLSQQPPVNIFDTANRILSFWYTSSQPSCPTAAGYNRSIPPFYFSSYTLISTNLRDKKYAPT